MSSKTMLTEAVNEVLGVLYRTISLLGESTAPYQKISVTDIESGMRHQCPKIC